MQDRIKIHNCVLLLLALFFFSCATTQAPRGWLASSDKTQTDVYGGWFEIKYSSASKVKAPTVGELIAISEDSIFIADQTFHAIARNDIKSARLVIYKSNSEGMGGLVALGTVSTISNGFFLIFTAPMWIIGGSIAAGARSYEPIVDYPKKELSSFMPFARYPQGLPLGIDRSQIKSKPRAL